MSCFVTMCCDIFRSVVWRFERTLYPSDSFSLRCADRLVRIHVLASSSCGLQHRGEERLLYLLARKRSSWSYNILLWGCLSALLLCEYLGILGRLFIGDFFKLCKLVSGFDSADDYVKPIAWEWSMQKAVPSRHTIDGLISFPRVEITAVWSTTCFRGWKQFGMRIIVCVSTIGVRVWVLMHWLQQTCLLRRTLIWDDGKLEIDNKEQYYNNTSACRASVSASRNLIWSV